MQPKTKEEWDRFWQDRWNDAKANAEGSWDSILQAKAPSLRAALEAAGKRHVPCPHPGHADSKDGFRVFKDFATTGGGICNTCGTFRDGFSLLRWINGWSGKEALEEVESYLGNRIGRHRPRALAPSPVEEARKLQKEKEQEEENIRLRRSLNRVWINSMPLTAPGAAIGRKYLSHRGLSMEGTQALRFHRNLVYHDGDKVVGHFAGITAVVSDKNGSPATIHRTFLDESGRKADVESPKKMMSYPTDRIAMGGAIRLCEPGEVLGVAEGIETALAAMQGLKIPVWATVSAVMMDKFDPPSCVKYLIVFADKDRGTEAQPLGHGQTSSRKLVERLRAQGMNALAVLPPHDIPAGQKSVDWLDVFKMNGSAGFPRLDFLIKKSMERSARV